MVTLRVGNDRVTFDGSEWRSEDQRLVRACEALAPEYSPADGRKDLAIARAVAAKLPDAEVVDFTPFPSADADHGLVY